MLGPSQLTRRDRIVIGASAGGITALPQLLSGLPADLPASIVVVQHMLPTSPGLLVDILARVSPLPVSWARHGEPIVPGRVYVARPDRHLLVDDRDRLLVDDGPRENYARPSINRLFRAAAAHGGNRTVGVVMTGTLDDGVAGAAAIKVCGGLVVAQDPADAEFSELPRNVIDGVAVDHVVALHDLARLLAHLVMDVVPRLPPDPVVEREADLDRVAFAEPAALSSAGRQMPYACPTCAGPMWQLGDMTSGSFRCFVGHTFSVRSLLHGQSLEIERSLWTAVRALQSRAGTWQSLADDARQRGHELSAVEYDRRARDERAHAERARAFLLAIEHDEPGDDTR